VKNLTEIPETPAGRLVAIHQPNFLPWLGFFRKLCRSDLFIILDDVQFPQTGGGTLVNRVRIMFPAGPGWLTVPVSRSFSGVRLCSEMLIDDSAPWRANMLKTLRSSYGRSPFFKPVFSLCEELAANPAERLMDFNLAGLRALLGFMRLPVDHLRLASDYGVDTTATQRLVDLVKACGGTGYLAGDGTAGYQRDALFAENGLELRRNNFVHPVYSQPKWGFVAGLSIVDALFNVGPEVVRALLRPEDPAATGPGQAG
jgi:hypothetical protein